MNNPNAWLQFALYVAALLLITKPLGLYLVRVLDPRGKTWLDPWSGRVERLTYRICGIDPEHEQGWIGYTVSLLLFSLVGMLLTYFILRFQDKLLRACSIRRDSRRLTPQLSFNTAASFTTNTNWQNYAGESTMSYLSQMVALASTISPRRPRASPSPRPWCAASPARRRRRSATSGSIWSASTYYLLVPICIVFALVLVSQGMIQNFKPYTVAKTLEPYTIQVPEDRRRRQARHGADGQTRDGGPSRGHADDRAGADGLPDRHQDARHQRRRLHQRQRRPSLREPDPALEFPPDALDLRDPERPDLLPRPDGEEPAPRLGGVGRHVR